jgi:CheY-like chemotaxis protein
MGAVVNQTQPIRLLLVEDEFLIREMVSEDLSEQGFSVCAVSNAGDALSHLASAAVDVLFTDVNLPGRMDGMALARRAREINPDLPVVYASGHVNVFVWAPVYRARFSSPSPICLRSWDAFSSRP